MSHESDIELVHADIDGELSDGQRDQLRERLAASSELCRYQAGLRELVGLLDSLPAVEPPDGLRQDLQQRLPLRSKRTFRGAGWRWAPPALRYAATFAAGLGIAAALFSTASFDGQSPEELARLAGTMLYEELPPGTTREDRLVLAQDEIRGDVTLNRSSDAWIVSFHLDSPAPLAVALEFGGLPFKGFAQLRNELQEVSVARDGIRLRSEGQQEFAVFLGETAEAGARLNLSIHAGHEQVAAGVLKSSR